MTEFRTVPDGKRFYKYFQHDLIGLTESVFILSCADKCFCAKSGTHSKKRI
ncbi:Uncharacterized protein dnm_088990 [Desulfonema magnum]|uniref:Uncharacterized protein n=1 Tax=Desulfonema magnum TaxID=45655 RepID=A0A975BWJ1_9BACT|nr:Uncharacterized protein dnm_088990 [Desulfonema magnum]